MKNIIPTLAALTGLALTPAVAESKGKEITLAGEVQCAKCNLKAATECQTVLVVEKAGKKTTCCLAKNAVPDKFHEEVCKAPKAASVTASCKKEGDTLVLTASKAEVANACLFSERIRMTRGGMLASSAPPMRLNFSTRLPFAILASSLALVLGGCATKEEIAAKRRWETEDERATREVFRSNWILPSVSEDEKDFYYRSWLRNGD
jgi:hypothetical protein